METKRPGSTTRGWCDTEMLPENYKCRREPVAVWYVLLGAAIATCLVVSYFNITTDQQSKAIHDLSSMSNGAQFIPDCISLLNETLSQSAPANSTTDQKNFEGLLPVLQNASTDDNTIIFTEINDAFANPDSILDLFIESFRVGEDIEHLLDHLVIVAMDQVSFERCKSMHRHCYLFKMDGQNFASEKFYMTKGFVDLVWTKIKLMQHMVELGYNVVFTDLDVLWFRNILKFVSAYYDITLSCDENSGGPEDIKNSPNTGLFYVKSTAKNVEVLNYWYEARSRFPDKNEQMVFNEIKKELVDQFQMKMRFVGTDHLSGFCNYGKDLNEVYTMQSNCCPGLKNKLNDLRGILDDWKRYKGSSGEEKMNRNFSWTVPRICLR